MTNDWKIEIIRFLIKFGALIAISPFAGLALLKFADQFEIAWKSNDRKKKKWLLASVFAFIAGLMGWLS